MAHLSLPRISCSLHAKVGGADLAPKHTHTLGCGVIVVGWGPWCVCVDEKNKVTTCHCAVDGANGVPNMW